MSNRIHKCEFVRIKTSSQLTITLSDPTGNGVLKRMRWVYFLSLIWMNLTTSLLACSQSAECALSHNIHYFKCDFTSLKVLMINVYDFTLYFSTNYGIRIVIDAH
ncbi:hypothetical protein BDF20DRAFT_838612 [Mycotypha africana]|uniref:uncharacterized protein n=1 Tax=Mycotypha africana TaxID=64632 RepID=UPI002301E603|nr:uncharacterized protein BDF20DRAFT_838612 [Mycotypha africana]KAI8970234.1 hypothetical protein BDF20DRAFT_838612 [Mycotypha africana]